MILRLERLNPLILSNNSRRDDVYPRDLPLSHEQQSTHDDAHTCREANATYGMSPVDNREEPNKNITRERLYRYKPTLTVLSTLSGFLLRQKAVGDAGVGD